MKEVPEDYDPVPEHMREAWDRMHQAIMSGETLSEEEMLALNNQFLAEMAETHSPEEVEEILQMAEDNDSSETINEGTTLFFEGHCPRCKHDHGQVVDMLLNYNDLWECPECHLQGHSASAGMFALMKTLGGDDLRPGNTKASDYADGWVLTCCETKELFPISAKGFRSTAALTDFLKTVN